ncbi:ABC transporter ATP-binding protein [Corynebacterium minutissimum]|uniref:ABC transport system, ATP-binding protein n=1 Tax=Corynebacterium minutissimum TaxID=38301 RepID=A0A376D0D7_9CORY|nr:ABC transporter ATP-binding protein [Corynebacterium minutissimum]QRP61282.1 ABC transporter ATP-binding protein [Corynebacterium minutissimum]STC79158.1 ABC transport system, ATP-binding protein [Corynebacterium minutissimum]
MTHPYREALAPDPRTQALAVRGLYKTFGNQTAVDHLNLDVPRGTIYGVVGPNGAGKTTMLTMACGLQRPDAGQSFIAGHDVWADPISAKQSMGLLMDGAPVFDRLTGAEYLHYLGALRRLDRGESLRRAQELLDALSLTDAANKRIVDYSAGMTKKILLAGAVLHNPEVLILDEPLEAVDPVSGRLIQQLLRAYASRGGTVILSSHVMELVEGLCDHVAIINGGQVITSGHVDDVRQGQSLSDLFIAAVGGRDLDASKFGWLRTSAEGSLGTEGAE